jgi:hypothetical protein
MGKPVAGQHLPQLADSLRIALKVRKCHAAILPNEKRLAGHAGSLDYDKCNRSKMLKINNI